MIRITEIQRDWQYICDQNAGIMHFLFDDTSVINQYTAMDFPLCLLKLPTKSTILDYKKNWELWDFTVFMCATKHEADEDTISEKYDSLRVLCEEAIDEFVFNPNQYQINDGVKFEYGHDEFNQNLVVVKADFQIRLFNCRDNTPSGQIVTITDNNSDLVGTVAGMSTLQVLYVDSEGNIVDTNYTLSNNVLTLTEINYLLLENEDYLLLENGDYLILG